MTKLHTIDYYMDGHIAIPFCKVCSAEGDKLLEDCQGYLDTPFYFRHLSKKEFEEKYNNALDQSTKAAK